jgi:hypothetical protein
MALPLLVVAALQLAGCGGGGGGSGGGGSNSSTNAGGGSTGSGTGSGSTGSGSTGTGTGSGSTSGGAASATFSLNTQSLVFSANSPAAGGPAAQTVTGTVTGSLSGTLYIVVTSVGSAVSFVTDFSINGNTGQASVLPRPPSILGTGTYSSTITVHACVNDATCATGELSGSPQTINVSYTVGKAIPANAVTPHVVTTGVAGQVVIRGSGLSGVTAISFGSTPATSVTAVSDTEVHASYPATLPAGSLAVTLNGNAIASPGSIVALAPQSYSTQTLTFPSGETPQAIQGVLYDAERSTLLVAGSFSQAANNKLWRYTYSGGTWSAATEAIIPSLQAITFSNDGAHLLALTGYSLLVLDPANPATPVSIVPAPFPQSSATNSPYFTGMALANDGYALVSTSVIGLGDGGEPAYLYSSTAGAFTAIGPSITLMSWPNGGSPMLAASADGSVVLAAQSGISGGGPVYQYSPETTLLTAGTIKINQRSFQPPVMDTSAAKRVVYTGSTNSVYDSNSVLLGNISGPVRVLTVNRQGTRLYALNTDNTLHTYDLTATPVGGNYPEVGTASTQTVPASSAQFAVRLAISPDGLGLFLAGDQGILVIPAPQ